MLVSDIAFTPAVKAQQERLGSRNAYAKMETRGGWNDRITPQLAEFIAERDSFYLGTASADGQPYIQHRGGPKGFLKVLDERTLALADFAGNAQDVSGMDALARGLLSAARLVESGALDDAVAARYERWSSSPTGRSIADGTATLAGLADWAEAQPRVPPLPSGRQEWFDRAVFAALV